MRVLLSSILATACLAPPEGDAGAPAETDPGGDGDPGGDSDPVAHTDVDTDGTPPAAPTCGPHGRTIVLNRLPLAWRTSISPSFVDRRADGKFALGFWGIASGPTLQIADRGARLGPPEVEGLSADASHPTRLGSLDGAGPTMWIHGTPMASASVQVNIDDMTDWPTHHVQLLQPEAGTAPGLLQVADVSGNGVPEVLATYVTTDGVDVAVFEGPWSGWSQLATPDDRFRIGTLETLPLRIVADLVGTPEVDLITTDHRAQVLRVLAGPLVAPGSPATTTTVHLTGTAHRITPALQDVIRVGDVDGDGHADLVVASALADAGRVDVYRGPLAAGDLHPSDAWATLVRPSTTHRLGDLLLVTDVDGDGASDVIASETSLAGLVDGAPPPARWSVWTGLQAGTRTDPDVTLVGPGWSPWHETFVGDVDGDGLVELAVPRALGVSFVTPCVR